jgi:hypothetical protein
VLLVIFGCFFEGVFLGASCHSLVCYVVRSSLWGAPLCICLRALLGF